MGYHFDWSVVLVPKLWLSAAAVTLIYAASTIVAGLLIGLLCGSILVLPGKWLKWPIRAYVQFIRCTPLLVQIVWFYYAFPIVIGFRFPAWAAAGIGLALYMGAFCAEVFRGGVVSIDRGQWEAARALGLSYLPIMTLVILPQAVRRMIAPFVNQSVIQLKDTSLLYVVAVPDLMYSSSILTSETYRPLEVYSFVALIYFALLFPMTVLSKRLELRHDR